MLVVSEVGSMTHTCEDDLVCKASMREKVPYFNAPIYLENKQQIGKVDEIFGPILDYVSLFRCNHLSLCSYQSCKIKISPKQCLLYCHHPNFDFYHIYSVQENPNIKVFATPGLTCQPDTIPKNEAESCRN